MRILFAVSVLCVFVAPTSSQAQGSTKEPPAFPETPTAVRNYGNLPAENVWKTVDGVYQKLRIKTTDRSAGRRVLANPAFVVQKELGAFKLTELFDCGADANGPIAANAPLVLSVQSSVKSLARGTELLTWVEARPAPAAGESSPRLACRSLGKLEQELQPDNIFAFVIRR